MKLSNIKAFANMAKHTIIKHSPEILMGVGVGSFIATVVLASKETIEEQEILETHKDALESAKDFYELGQLDDKAYKSSRMKAYKYTVIETSKNYIPSITCGAVSLTCFLSAYGIMKKRYTTLLMAYATLEESFRAYRQRVIEDKGAEADLYYLTGAKPKEITVKDENGNKTKVKQLILPDGEIASPYCFKFSKYKENGDLNNQWKPNQMLNRAYVQGQLDYINRQILFDRTVFTDDWKVKVRGWYLLNELRELMGEDGTSTGAVVGNLLGNGEPGCNGCLIPKIFEATEIDPETNEEIPCIFIDPNVDGLIYDLIGKKESEPFELTNAPWSEDYNI